MNDPRLDETHLHSQRREEYRHARDEVFGAMGPNTGDVEREFHACRLPLGFVPPPAGLLATAPDETASRSNRLN